MQKEEMRLDFLHELKFGHNASETATNIKKELNEEFICDRTVLHRFVKFHRSDRNLVDQIGRGRPSAISNQHLKTLAEQKPTSKCKRNISNNGRINFKKSGKVKKHGKWIPHELYY